MSKQDKSVNENRYVLDSESPIETARLVELDQVMTMCMGGPLPPDLDFDGVTKVLDVACGPGGWVLDVARENPTVEVTGIDISRSMTAYARARALSQDIDNADFLIMDVLQPLKFVDNSFDFVNGRFLFGFLSRHDWPRLVQECVRVTRPGGIIRLTELEPPITSSAALERLWALFCRAYKITDRSFSPTGHTIGITAMLERLLIDAGCRDIKMQPYVINYSANSPYYESVCQNDLIAIKLLEPFYIKSGVITQEEFTQLYSQMVAEVRRGDFRALWGLLSVWGQKPLT